jgi:DNA-binding response OmpR family regulator
MLRTRYDVLLLDLFMNGETARSFYEEVVGNGRMPVIVVSASSDVRHRIQALEAGCYDYITKPFDESEFVARIRVAAQRYAKLRSLLRLGNGGNPWIAESVCSSERMQSGAASLPR